MSKGASLLSALQTRLKGIQAGAGYTNTIQQVAIDRFLITQTIAESDLPAIEVVQESETYEHDVGTGYWSYTQIVLYLVAPKFWTDSQMEDFKQDVRRCLFGGSASATGNTGVSLGGLVQDMRLVDSVADMNMIHSNRVYLLRIRLKCRRTTFSD